MAPTMQNWFYFAALLLLSSSCNFGSAFTTTSRPQKLQTPRTTTSLSETKVSKENWTFNPFDVNDLSPLDTLLRRGVVPLGVRLGRPQKYEDAVLEYMRKERCDRATAQRNMDAFFNDPNGWVVSYQRKRDLGEDFGDINAPTGVQKRPVFSLLWGSFCVWLFFVFFPTRIQELGGIEPSFTTPGGACLYQKRDANGALYCENGPKAFEKSAMDYLDKQK
eukprot:CAMPEP_0116151832 /NCGR_PEP_ID=MMETSP0329-20121206/20313_1 /TAXON_ID=697910 /ORGANISM="Pseudo-nitzschia arenysensis, Strain B593" /LENGTH=219 /DNA_ID=CAMNT_0003648483 /DNA_START=63 /DNA_END=722 /DNA_ORIENTATION=-